MEARVPDPVIVTASACCSYAPGTAGTLDPLPFLKSRKMRKFMGKQDELAVVAAGTTLMQRTVDAGARRDRTGIYMTVGYIPFERADIDAMAKRSVAEGRFSIEQFATAGIEQVNPLLTFRCLPNMPIFHVSLNCTIQGPYFVTYPGAGQFYLALERAVTALQAREIDYALVGAVADQNNFLVEYDRKRRSEVRDRTAYDVGAFLLLERSTGAASGFELIAIEQRYITHDPWTSNLSHHETFTPTPSIPGDVDFGPASLPAYIHCARQSQLDGEWNHQVRTRDGVVAESRWRRR